MGLTTPILPFFIGSTLLPVFSHHVVEIVAVQIIAAVLNRFRIQMVPIVVDFLSFGILAAFLRLISIRTASFVHQSYKLRGILLG